MRDTWTKPLPGAPRAVQCGYCLSPLGYRMPDTTARVEFCGQDCRDAEEHRQLELARVQAQRHSPYGRDSTLALFAAYERFDAQRSLPPLSPADNKSDGARKGWDTRRASNQVGGRRVYRNLDKL